MVDPTDIPLASEDAVETPESPLRQRSSLTSGKISAGKYDIDPNRPLEDFAHEFADAYECTSHDTGLNDHVAIVIKGRYPARQDVISLGMTTDIPGMLSLRTAFPLYWTPDNIQRYVLVYQRPSGNAIISRNAPRREPLSEDIIRHGVIRPIFYALRSFADRGMFHGNIRPDNIFLTGSDNGEAVLGECASSIPGIIQPVIYETIERGMADKAGRGVGLVSDDIYAFGAAIAVMLRGFDPMEGRSAEFVTEEKINRSSYTVLTDGMRLSPGLSELLRATLNDDSKQRWGIDQVASWVEGTRATPKQTAITQKAQRAIDFNQKKYLRPRLLARDLTDNVPEAVGLIENGHVSKWIERAIGDQSMAEAVNQAVSRAAVGGRTAGYEERLLCFVSMALDPRAPIRFKDINAFPSGIGFNLAYAMINQKKMQNFGELIRDRYPSVLLSMKENAGEYASDLLRQFDLASKIISRRGIDFGLERCLYELCPHVPCLSDMLKNYYVINCGILIHALEEVAETNKSSRPIDRHIASFISVNDSRDNTGIMTLLEGNDMMRKSLALITLYQGLQKRFDNPKLVRLCEWLAKDAEYIAQRFRSVPLRQEVLKQIPKEVKTGSLTRVMALIDNALQVKKDESDFTKASRYYVALGRERDMIRKGLDNDPNFGLKTGRQIALTISLILSGLMLASTFLLNYADKLGG